MDPFGYVGTGLGSLLGGVGRVLEPLDYPRRALWDLPGAIARGDWEEALPGLSALGMGAGLAATGVGLPLAALGGAVAGGLGTAAAGGLEHAPRGADLVRMLGGNPESWGGWGAGMALDVAGDPLTYAGGLGGRHLATPEGVEQAQRFLADETGALGLRYDFVPESMSIELARHDPEWINNRTWYHGSGTPGITSESINPLETDPNNLFGRGIYTSDEGLSRGNPVTQGYAETRAEERRKDLIRSLETPLGLTADSPRSAPDLARYTAADLAAQDVVKRLTATAPNPNLALVRMVQGGPAALSASRFPGRFAHTVLGSYLEEPESFASIMEAIRGAGIPTPAELPRPVIYQAQPDFGKILNLDQPLPKRLIDPLTAHMEQIARANITAEEAVGLPGSMDLGPIEQWERSSWQEDPTLESFRHLLKRPKTSAGQIISAIDQPVADLRELTSNLPPGLIDPLKLEAARVLKELGYDALTHTGGQRASGGDILHQVVIGLDPNDVYGVGRKTPYRIWEEMKGP